MAKNNGNIEVYTYIIYMIMGSYFKKAVCVSSIKEKQLRIGYNEVKKDNQIKFEEYCETYIENKVIGVIPNEIFEDMAEVKFITSKDKKRIYVVFEGFDWKLVMWADNTNAGIKFDYKFGSTNHNN